MMKARVMETEENPILNRKEVKVIIEFEGRGTPGRGEVISELKKLLDVKKKLIALRKIKSVYGMNTVYVYANIYNNEQVLKETEPNYVLKRMKEKKKEEKGEESGGGKKEEKSE